MKTNVKNSIVFTLVCILLLIPSVAYAHGMFLRLVEPGVLEVEYDGGGFSTRTEVTLYDKEGNELDKGMVDEEGKYHFDEGLGVHSAVADDGMGHRAEYKEGVEETTGIPKLPAVLAVFAIIAVISIFFKKRAQTKTQ